MVSFRMREVLLPSSLSGKMRRMQPLSTCASVSFCTRCMERLTVKVPSVGGIKVDVLRGQTGNLTLSECTHQRQVHRQMQDGVLHAVQCCPHLLHLQMLRSWVVFLGASTGTGLLIRMPHSTASRKELCSSWWTSWRVVPERVRFCCLGERSRRLPPTYCPQGVLLRVSYRASMW